MTAYESAQKIIRDTIVEFGGQATNIETIITDRIKAAGLKIEYRAATKPAAKATTKAATKPKE